MTVEAQVRGVFALYAQGKYAEGLTQARRIHKAAPQLAIANYCVGHGLAASQQPREALPFLRKATQIEPRNADFLVRYGRVLLEEGKVRDAETVLRRAYDLNPALPIAPYTLGNFYASIDRFDLAVRYYKQVLDAQLLPDMRATVTMDWASALTEVGQLAEAQTVLQAALGHATTRVSALATLADFVAFEPGTDLARMLDEELAKPAHSGTMRSGLLMAKAKMAARQNDHEAEFALIGEAKKSRGSIDGNGQFETAVNNLCRTFGGDEIAALQGRFGQSGFRPIFVIGLPRSGTTLTEKILSAHSEVGGAGELGLIADLSRNLLQGAHASSVMESLAARSVPDVKAAITEVEATMRYLRPGKDRIVDKMPHNFLHCWLIRVIFPEAKIVHCFRDPADNFLSGYKAALHAFHFCFDRPQWFIPYYRNYRQLMCHWYDVLPGAIFPLRYEDLVTNPEHEIRALLRFCDLPFEEACLSPEENTSRIGTASVLQARSPINAKSVGGWKRYAQHLQVIADALGSDRHFPQHAG